MKQIGIEQIADTIQNMKNQEEMKFTRGRAHLKVGQDYILEYNGKMDLRCTEVDRGEYGYRLALASNGNFIFEIDGKPTLERVGGLRGGIDRFASKIIIPIKVPKGATLEIDQIESVKY